MRSQQILFRDLRLTVALMVGIPFVALVTGTFYSLSGIHGGHYGAAIFLAIAHGFMLWIIFRLGRCERLPAKLLWLTLIVGALGPVAIGHTLGYGDLQWRAYRLVQADTSGRYPPRWKGLGREELFPKWVGFVTGKEGGGVWGYLRAQSAIGWEGTEGRSLKIHVVRTGVWSWVAWFCHLTLFLVAGAAAHITVDRGTTRNRARVGDQLTDVSQPAAPALRSSGDQGVILEKGAKEISGQPEDKNVISEWSNYSDQQDVLVSFRCEPRAAFPSLQEFFVHRVRQNLSQYEGKHNEADVRNYVERVCHMKDLSRNELVQFISRHSISTQLPKVPEELRAAISCRDEAETKLTIWETDEAYWEMVWSKGRGWSSGYV